MARLERPHVAARERETVLSTPALPVVLSLILLIGACHSGDPSPQFAEFARPVQNHPVEVSSVTLDLVTEYGQADGDQGFGRIADLAAHPSGLLAVADALSCKVTLIDRHTGDSWTIGGCGCGPGEFVELDRIIFHGDTIVAFDHTTRDVVFLDLDGVEVRRLRPEVLRQKAPWLARLGSLDDSTLLLALSLIPSSCEGAEHDLLAVTHGGTGQTLRRVLRDSPLSQADRRNLLREYPLCANREPGIARVAVGNIWSSQVVTFQGSELEPQGNFETELEWWRYISQGGGPSEWSVAGVPRMACGKDYLIVLYRQARRVDRYRNDWVVTNADVEIRRYSGEIVYSHGDPSPELGSVLLMTPGAAAEGRFYMFTHYFAEYPVVRDYRLEEHPAGSSDSG